MYQYRPQNEDELELRAGDRVDVMQQCDDGWFVGTWAGMTMGQAGRASQGPLGGLLPASLIHPPSFPPGTGCSPKASLPVTPP